MPSSCPIDFYDNCRALFFFSSTFLFTSLHLVTLVFYFLHFSVPCAYGTGRSVLVPLSYIKHRNYCLTHQRRNWTDTIGQLILMSFWCLQIFQKTNNILSRISALVSKKSNWWIILFWLSILIWRHQKDILKSSDL